MRKLTLFGKITAIKFLLESQLVYKLSVLPNPSHQMLKEIDQTLFNFSWDNKPHRITKHVAIEPRDLGGLSINDWHLHKKYGAISESNLGETINVWW